MSWPRCTSSAASRWTRRTTCSPPSARNRSHISLHFVPSYNAFMGTHPRYHYMCLTMQPFIKVSDLLKSLIDLHRRRAKPSSKQASQSSCHVPSILSTPHSNCSQRHRTDIRLQLSRDWPRACRYSLALALFARYKHSRPVMISRFTTHLL